MASKALDDAVVIDVATKTASSDFEPILLFFYENLGTPSVLQRILRLPEEPTLDPVQIYGYKVKLWGPYPALAKNDSSDGGLPPVLGGCAYEVTEKSQLERLKTFKGKNFALEKVKIHDISPETGKPREREGATFVWSGLPGLLKDGSLK
ncbi:hypothetical protein TWF730_000476 [Orbilia blumenaviensis]|uniref:Gamma-glutamylcyclotransferase AIG2-like domain-containing protein n=1 Tax=Orbilia blumenaviensis TaxID=1796055 RepID=A0AAV9VM04_9PEZI